MSVIVLFNISEEEKYVDALTLLKNNGYWAAWTTPNNNKSYDFPKHSLWKPKVTPSESYTEIQELLKNNKLSLTNLMVFSYTTWKGLERQKK